MNSAIICFLLHVGEATEQIWKCSFFHFWNTEYHVKDTSCQLNSISECIYIVWILIFEIKFMWYQHIPMIHTIMTFIKIDYFANVKLSLLQTITILSGICNLACFTEFLPGTFSSLFHILLTFSCKTCINLLL